MGFRANDFMGANSGPITLMFPYYQPCHITVAGCGWLWEKSVYFSAYDISTLNKALFPPLILIYKFIRDQVLPLTIFFFRIMVDLAFGPPCCGSSHTVNGYQQGPIVLTEVGA